MKIAARTYTTLILLITGFCFTTFPKQPDKPFGIVNLSVSNIRSAPRNSAELSTQALLGTKVIVLRKNDDWFFIRTPDMYTGWIDGGGFQPMDEKELDEWEKVTKIIYTDFFGFSYSAEDISSQPVSDLVYGDILEFTSENDNYYKVEYPDKRIAYVSKKSASYYDSWANKNTADEQTLITTAKSFMGIPYLWGGTSVKGVDCSGFTKMVFFLNGIMLPRDASQQANTGETVDTKNGFENLLPGDLLFFGNKATNSSKEKVTHVAMYIGNNEYIHSSGMVKINSLDKTKENFSEGRFNAFVKAKRILSSIDKNGVYSIKTQPPF